MRYAGQEHNLTVPMEAPDGAISASADAVLEAFTREYERTFRNTMEEDAEIVSIRATLRLPLPRRESEYRSAAAGGAGGAEVEAYSFTEDRRQTFRIVARESLRSRRYGRRPGHRHGGDRDDLSRCRVRSAARRLRLPVPEIHEGLRASLLVPAGDAIRPTPPGRP